MGKAPVLLINSTDDVIVMATKLGQKDTMDCVVLLNNKAKPAAKQKVGSYLTGISTKSYRQFDGNITISN